ncbi:ABC transporter permease subunit [Nocardioides sp. W3-2-3]|uniref:ABC transporter permease subunit n=1 Tax=Nocardioides convexus TaxID=2712224 RepID=UPI00241895A2|nr:ABC transporter permease subunit [Nocardioides convexus]NGZ99700.1 ABC transporter permease subunit [Nocardioides convexus]
MMLAITSSLTIAITGTILTVIIGAVLGIVAGFSGGIVDAVVGRIIDLTLSFPQTMMLLALSGPVVLMLRNNVSEFPGLGFFGNADLSNGFFVIIILAVFGWPPIARVVRGQVLSIREREFIEAAKAARRVPLAAVLQGGAAQRLGARPGLRDAAGARLHLRRGRVQLPRCRHQAADADAGQHPVRLRQLHQRGPDVLLPPGDPARPHRRGVQPRR